MFTFMWPWVGIAILGSWFYRKWMKPAQKSPQSVSHAIIVPFWDRLSVSSYRVQNTTLSKKHQWGLILTGVFLTLACMRPVWLGPAQPMEREAHNIMLALDVSGSMNEVDFTINNQPISRLEMLKNLSHEFIASRQGDNIGIVIFGSEGYTYAPLSPDIVTLHGLLGEIGIGIAGTQTAIGEALALSIQGVASVPANSQIVILMSDGYNNAGRVSIAEALQIAKAQGTKVYTIGIGSDAQMIRDFFGLVQINPAQDLDEATLKSIAQETDGQYFRAKSAQDLREIYNLINQLEPIQTESEMIRPRKELFFIPLIVAMLGLCLILSVGGRS